MKCPNCFAEWYLPEQSPNHLRTCPFCGNSIQRDSKKVLSTIEDVLGEMIEKFGVDILRDGTKTVAVFSDLAPQLRKQRLLLTYLTQFDGNQKLLEAREMDLAQQKVQYLKVVQYLTDEQYVDQTAAENICLSFLKAIGVTLEMSVPKEESSKTTNRIISNINTDTVSRDFKEVGSELQMNKKEHLFPPVNVRKEKEVDVYLDRAQEYLRHNAYSADTSNAFECLQKAEDILNHRDYTDQRTIRLQRTQIARLYNKYSRTKADKCKAFELYYRSWDEGEVRVLYEVGWMYYMQGFQSSYSRVDDVKLLEQLREEAPKSNVGELAYLLGHIYSRGYRVKRNSKEAEKWWLLAIRKGNRFAYGALTRYYANDLKKYNKAFSLAEEGHRMGVSEATYYLGQCYANGIGVKKSRSKAKMYYKEAAAKGHSEAKKEIEKYLI